MKSLFTFLKQHLPGKKLVLLGETHGTKEIPLLLTEFFSTYARHSSFTICLELPEENQVFIDRFFTTGKETDLNSIPFFSREDRDGRDSLEYLHLIQHLYSLKLNSKKEIKIHCIDTADINIFKNQNKREAFLANKILSLLSDQITFVIIGDIHASKKIISFPGIEIITTGSILSKKLGNKLLAVSLQPQSGSAFNGEIKLIEKPSSLPSYYDLSDYYDLTYPIKHVTPCSFLH